ncbi:hypothetical protein DMUE_4371 [Dictyocoela muelleri]|nr:hypothetical protein DMUE_4371 [Dictyocoela muelleri]
MDNKSFINKRKSISIRVHRELGNLLMIEDGVDKYWDKIKEEMENDDDIIDISSSSDNNDEISFPTTCSESFNKNDNIKDDPENINCKTIQINSEPENINCKTIDINEKPENINDKFININNKSDNEPENINCKTIDINDEPKTNGVNYKSCTDFEIYDDNNYKIINSFSNNDQEFDPEQLNDESLMLNHSAVSDTIINNFIGNDKYKISEKPDLIEVQDLLEESDLLEEPDLLEGAGMFTEIDNENYELKEKRSKLNNSILTENSRKEGKIDNFDKNCEEIDEFDYFENPKKRIILNQKTNKSKKHDNKHKFEKTETFIQNINDYYNDKNGIIPLLITPGLETTLIVMEQFSYIRSIADSSFFVLILKGTLFVEILSRDELKRNVYFVKRNSHFMIEKGMKYYFRNEKSAVVHIHVSFLL